MLDKLLSQWKTFMGIGAIVLVFWQFYNIEADASDAKSKVDQHQETFKNIEQIAQGLTDPNRSLREFLKLHGVPVKVAESWSWVPRSPVLDSLGKPYPNMRFYLDEQFPYLGVVVKYTDEMGLKIIDTTWDFRDKIKGDK